MLSSADFNGNIQHAIDIAHDMGGGYVYVPSGVHVRENINLRSRVKLLGAGTLKAASGVSKFITLDAGAFDWSIEGFLIDGSDLVLGDDGRSYCFYEAPGGGSYGGTIKGLTFTNIRRDLGQVTHGIQLNAKTARVLDCRFDGSGGDAIALNVGAYVVSGNLIENSGDGGIAANNRASGSLTNNIIRKCDLGIGSGPAGTTADPYAPLIIGENTIEACGVGIGLGWFGFDGRTGPQHVKVAGNVVAKSKNCGIRYDGNAEGFSSGLSITGNSVVSGGAADYDGAAGDGHGIILSSLDDAALSGNIIRDNAGKGLSCPSTVEHIAVGANIIRGNAVGVDFTNADDWAWGENVVSGNAVDFIGSPSA